jgi:hypothetical protein
MRSRPRGLRRLELVSELEDEEERSSSPVHVARTDDRPELPSPRAKARSAPAAIAGRIAGITIARNVFQADAPSTCAASSSAVSSSRSTGCTVRTTNGSVTTHKARRTAS